MSDAVPNHGFLERRGWALVLLLVDCVGLSDRTTAKREQNFDTRWQLGLLGRLRLGLGVPVGGPQRHSLGQRELRTRFPGCAGPRSAMSGGRSWHHVLPRHSVAALCLSFKLLFAPV